MQSIHADMQEFRALLEMGSVQKAYQALLAYMQGLRTHLKDSFPRSTVSGLYQGAMDMTFFALIPEALEHHNLKVAILFNYDAFRFEAWLVARNRSVQRKYWELLKDSSWPEYRVSTPGKGVDSILEYDLTAAFNLDKPGALTSTITSATGAFIDNIEGFLTRHKPLR